jgi:transcriptional regulator with XRE-family HTH domain
MKSPARESAREAARKHLKPFGRHIRRLRRDRDLTQDQLAERAGLDPRVIRFVESGERDVGISTLWMLASALGVEVADLIPPTTKAR